MFKKYDEIFNENHKDGVFEKSITVSTDSEQAAIVETLEEIASELGASTIDDLMANIEAAADELPASSLIRKHLYSVITRYSDFGTDLIKAIASIKKIKSVPT